MNINARNKIIILVSTFAALTAVGAYLKIPLPHVPITLQTFFVIMSGNLLGFKFGTLSQLLYLTVGILGIPVFAYGGGPGYVFQPTFGYLLGYPFCAFTIGILIKLFFSKFRNILNSKVRNFFVFFIADFIGVLIIFAFGLAYLFVNLKFGFYMKLGQILTANLNWQSMLKTTFLIFIPIDIIKACFASWLMIPLQKIARLPVEAFNKLDVNR